MQAVRYARLDALPAAADALFGPGYALSRSWFAASEAAALPPGARPVWLLAGTSALLPMVAVGGRLVSMTTPYTWDFAVLGRLDAAAAAALGRACRGWPVTLIEALDAGWAGLPVLEQGLRAAGLVVRRFAHFGNWRERLGGRDWAAYLADRPGQLREVLRRRRRDAGDSLRAEMIAAPGDVGRGIAAYERIYARSWKVPEPYPAFGPTLLRAAAAQGALRLALLWRGDEPVAAQYWVLGDGTATVLKLAHDEAYRALSPGTLLTAWAIERLIAADAVAWLDFGRGDDGYKRLWAGERRAHVGLLACAPWHPVGLAALARQVAGEVRRAMLRRAKGGEGMA